MKESTERISHLLERMETLQKNLSIQNATQLPNKYLLVHYLDLILSITAERLLSR